LNRTVKESIFSRRKGEKGGSSHKSGKEGGEIPNLSRSLLIQSQLRGRNKRMNVKKKASSPGTQETEVRGKKRTKWEGRKGVKEGRFPISFRSFRARKKRPFVVYSVSSSQPIGGEGRRGRGIPSLSKIS